MIEKAPEGQELSFALIWQHEALSKYLVMEYYLGVKTAFKATKFNFYIDKEEHRGLERFSVTGQGRIPNSHSRTFFPSPWIVNATF